MIRQTIAAAMLLAMAASFVTAAKQKTPAMADYAVIIGTVYGPDDRPAAGVTIDIRRADAKKPKWELTSDNRGEFAQRVPAEKADYRVVPKLKDKAAAEKSAVQVHIEKNERQDVTLHLIQQELPKR